MEIKEAIKVLKHHNVWRKGDDENAIMTNPKRLGVAIDVVVNEFENLFISGVSKSFYCFDRVVTGRGKECKKQCDRCRNV